MEKLGYRLDGQKGLHITMENKIRKKTVRSIIDELWEKNTVLDERKIRWFNGNLTDMLIQLYNYRINDLERLYITGALVERIRMTPHEEEISLCRYQKKTRFTLSAC